jgi:hypothetical protein
MAASGVDPRLCKQMFINVSPLKNCIVRYQVEAEDFLRDAGKGAFVIRKSNNDFVMALQCGPLVNSRIGHMRLADISRDDKTWLNVSGTEVFF